MEGIDRLPQGGGDPMKGMLVKLQEIVVGVCTSLGLILHTGAGVTEFGNSAPTFRVT